jgi:dethiobiotin synthetase
MNKIDFPKAFFVSGTDTDVGKTVVSAVLCHGLEAHYWKPVQSGLPADVDFITSTGVPKQRIIAERHRFSQPLSPHLAARLDKQSITLNDFALPDCSKMNHLIVEGAGGLLVPLNDKDKVIDLISFLQLPVLLVARSALGTINHTLLSLEALRARKLEIFGVVMTGNKNSENRKAIEQYGNIKVIAELPQLADFNQQTLVDCFFNEFQGGIVQNANDEKRDLASVHSDAHGRAAT